MIRQMFGFDKPPFGQSFYLPAESNLFEYDDATEMANMKDISARNSLKT